MNNTYKQSGVRATNLEPNQFKKAVWKLTAYYTAGVFLILVVFSVLVYGLFVKSIDEDLYEDERQEHVEDRFHDEIKDDLSGILIFSDIIFLVVSLCISYFLSKKTLAPIEISYHQQKKFMADAAHELRTPLAVLKAGSELLLQKERSGEEYREFTTDFLEEVERLSTISNELLFLSQNRVNEPNRLSKISLSEVCEKQCGHIYAYAESKKVSLTAEITPNIFILGLKDDLARMIMNILKNAVDYNKQDGQVFVTLKQVGQKALILVKDTGQGIAQNDLPHIFDRFFKADTSRTVTPASGTGLGLAIVKEIVLGHSGSIKAASEVGVGTTFEIEFPLE